MRKFLFCGYSQNNISFEPAAGMQKMGDGEQYAKSADNGKIPFDFHMAFHIGKLSIEDAEGVHPYRVKDKGFESLIAHPRRIDAPKNKTNSHFTEKMKDDELEVIVKELQAKKFTSIDGERVSYSLPGQA